MKSFLCCKSVMMQTFVCGFIALTGSPAIAQKPDAKFIAEAREIYSTVLNSSQYSKDEKLVVDDETTPASNWIDHYFDMMTVPGTSAETAASFMVNNTGLISLKKVFASMPRIHFTADGYAASLASSKGPRNPILTFSNIGFNRKHDQALITFSNYCGIRCGAGYLILLDRKKGRWKVTREFSLWVS